MHKEDQSVTEYLLERMKIELSDRGLSATDYRIAKELGTTPSAVNNWKNTQAMDVDNVARICEWIWPGQTKYVLFYSTIRLAERHGNPEVTALWSRLAGELLDSADEKERLEFMAMRNRARSLIEGAASVGKSLGVALLIGLASLLPPPAAQASAAGSFNNNIYCAQLRRWMRFQKVCLN